jgi:eukaryotic-like serine/threonine-protein kinase
MTPERWQQVKDILATALELPPGERLAYLDRSCASDHSLRGEVNRLLQDEHQVDPQFLGSTALGVLAAAVLPEQRNPCIGRLIGAYRIVQQIGTGGMGEVYRAVREDDEYLKPVALKIIRAGQDSGFVISRFRNERQILSTLDHPNIARWMDGGTTEEGLPYLVMELIEGQPITDYCDQHRLSITERLRLFSQVCGAVQNAHQHLIIHRDIKPGNILVTPAGTPKLLDFGIAKILNLDSPPNVADATLTTFRALTPRYASPEQIKGEPMTTETDVYSLGMVLYELLTGSVPYRLATGSPEEMAEAVCRNEPRKPSLAVLPAASNGDDPDAARHREIARARGSSPERLHKRLIGDLDTVLLKALRKEPSRRYASVDRLAEDLRRHLENVPVLARNDTLWYRASKFVARHRAAVAVSALVTLAMVSALTLAVHEARVAELQRARAERRFNDVRKLANSLMFEVHDSIKDLPGATAARKLLMDRAVEYLDSLSQEASGDVALQGELAAAYDRVGDLLGYNGAANLGDLSGALKSYQKALAIRESAVANAGKQQMREDLLNDYFHLSFVLNDSGDYVGALANVQKAIPLAQRMVELQAEPKYRDWLAGFYWQQGNVLMQTHHYADALESFRRAASIREPVAGETAANPLLRAHLAADYIGLGRALFSTGDLTQALNAVKKGTEILEQLTQRDPTNGTLREYLGEAYSRVAVILQNQGDLDRALAFDRKANDVFVELSKADGSNSLARDNHALTAESIAGILVRQGKIDAAIRLLRDTIAVFHSIEHKNRYEIAGERSSYLALARAYLALAEKNSSEPIKTAHIREAQLCYKKSLDARQRETTPAALDDLFAEDDSEQQVAEQLARYEVKLGKPNIR